MSGIYYFYLSRKKKKGNFKLQKHLDVLSKPENKGQWAVSDSARCNASIASLTEHESDIVSNLFLPVERDTNSAESLNNL